MVDADISRIITAIRHQRPITEIGELIKTKMCDWLSRETGQSPRPAWGPVPRNGVNKAKKECNVLTFDLDYSDYITITCEINDIQKGFSYLIDTQADISVLKFSAIPGRPIINTSNVINIKGITQDSMQSLGTLHEYLFTGHDVIGHEFHVVPDEFNIDCHGIIGKDFLVYYRCKIDYDWMTFTINNRYKNILRLSNGPESRRFKHDNTTTL